jgi:hypothetical protein
MAVVVRCGAASRTNRSSRRMHVECETGFAQMRLRTAVDKSWKSVYRTGIWLFLLLCVFGFCGGDARGQFRVLEYWEPKSVNERWRKPRGSVEMDDLDGGRLDAERLRGEYGLKEGASEEELELRMMTIKVAGCAQQAGRMPRAWSSDGALCSGLRLSAPSNACPGAQLPLTEEWVMAPHS